MSSLSVDNPPAGIDLSENHNTETIGGVVALIILGVSAMVLRLVAHRYTPIPESFHADDWVLIAALVCTCSFFSFPITCPL